MIQPNLDEVQTAINTATQLVVNVIKDVEVWKAGKHGLSWLLKNKDTMLESDCKDLY